MQVGWNIEEVGLNDAFRVAPSGAPCCADCAPMASGRDHRFVMTADLLRIQDAGGFFGGFWRLSARREVRQA